MILKENLDETISNRSHVVKITDELLNMEDEISRQREHFYVFGLNTKGRVLYVELCSLGTLSSTLIHPREVFRIAILKGCCSIITAHNHPSGNPEPSGEDKVMTARLNEAGEILGINVLDHIIIGREECYSQISGSFKMHEASRLGRPEQQITINRRR